LFVNQAIIVSKLLDCTNVYDIGASSNRTLSLYVQFLQKWVIPAPPPQKDLVVAALLVSEVSLSFLEDPGINSHVTMTMYRE